MNTQIIGKKKHFTKKIFDLKIIFHEKKSLKQKII